MGDLRAEQGQSDRPPIPEEFEASYDAVLDIFMAYASGTSAFTLRELRGHFDEQGVASTGHGKRLTGLVDALKYDVVEAYSNQEPPVDVGWMTLRDGNKVNYSLGVRTTNEAGRRSFQSPVSLVLKRLVRQSVIEETGTDSSPTEANDEITPVDTPKPTPTPQSTPDARPTPLLMPTRPSDTFPEATAITTPDTLTQTPFSAAVLGAPVGQTPAVTPEAPALETIDVPESDNQQERLTKREEELFRLIEFAIDLHDNKRMRPHWFENKLSKAGFKYKPETIHRVLLKAEKMGLLYLTTHKSQVYYTTLRPEPEPETETNADDHTEKQAKNERAINETEIAAIADVLEGLAGSLSYVPDGRSMRQTVGKYQGKVSKDIMNRLLRASERANLIRIYVDKRDKKAAGPRIEMPQHIRIAWITGREEIMEVVKGLRVRGK